LHSEELHNFYSSPNINRQINSRSMRWPGYVAHIRYEREIYKVLVEKPEGKTPLGRPKLRYENIISSYLS
jgi:hypothetical protein